MVACGSSLSANFALEINKTQNLQILLTLFSRDAIIMYVVFSAI